MPSQNTSVIAGALRVLGLTAVLLVSPIPRLGAAIRARGSGADGVGYREVSSRIANGIDTSSYAPVGTLLFEDDAGATELLCTGTLVGCQTFLTAAHCVCPARAMDHASCLAEGGPTDPARLVAFFPEAGFVRVSRVAINPAYDFGVAGDLAVVKLAEPVTGIQASAIATAQAPPLGTAGVIVGYGGTGGRLNPGVGVKRTGRLSTGSCEPQAPDSTHVCWTFDAPIGPAGSDSTTCLGDSGGPLFVDLGDGDTLAGVTSFGVSDAPPFDGECAAPKLTGDTSVFAYHTWVQTQMGRDPSGQACGALPPVGSADTVVRAESGTLNDTHPADAWMFDVPSGATALRIGLNAELAHIYRDPNSREIVTIPTEFALYVAAGRPASSTDFDCAERRNIPFGFCAFDAPAAGTWHVRVERYGGSGTYQLTATTFGATPLPTPGPTAGCVGDCDTSGDVTITELVTMVNLALGSGGSCAAADANQDGAVTIDEIVRAVNGALFGCG